MKTLEWLEQYRQNKINEMRQKAEFEKQAFLREQFDKQLKEERWQKHH